MKKTLLIALCLLLTQTYAQDIWISDHTKSYDYSNGDNPKQYHQLTLNSESLEKIIFLSPSREEGINSSIKIPLPISLDKMETFTVYKASNFSKELSDKFPDINSYVGKSVSSSKIARFSYSKHTGFQGYIYNGDNTFLIKILDLSSNVYQCYFKKSIEINNTFACLTEDFSNERAQGNSNDTIRLMDDTYLRKYRLAVASTSEFSSYFLTGAENDTERIAIILSQINNSLTRINSIFERDFGVIMQLVPNNDQLIYFNDSSDPFYNDYNSEIQNVLDSVIGSSNYDVGHLFGYDGATYGNAGCIACVCTSGTKGSAYTFHENPSSDHFNIIACHEFGHQFGGYHVQSSSNCRSSAELQEVEPGSGSTILSYAGICTPNVQAEQDDYFNYVDIRDVITWTRENASCAELISTTNNEPNVQAGLDYTIPISTAFILEGEAQDSNSVDVLTYCWEQNNPENPYSFGYPQSNRIYGPMYRSILPSTSLDRYLPSIENVIQNNLTPDWEVTPSVDRTLNFVLTARDNAIIGAKTASDAMEITVTSNAGPFEVISQETPTIWDAGTSQLITWDVANTNNAPVNTSNVEILLSVDGGYTYPYTLVSSTPNNGSATVLIPSIAAATSQARVMVKALDNIYYALNKANITINLSDFTMNFDPLEKEVCSTNTDTIDYEFTYNTFLGFNENTIFSLANLPSGLTASFSPASATLNNTEVTLSISGISILSNGLYSYTVKGTSNTVEKTVEVSLSVYEDTLSPSLLISPLDQQTNMDLQPEFYWEENANASSYTLQIATNSSFTSIIEETTIENPFYSLVNSLHYGTEYYWRILSDNSCNNTAMSSIRSFYTNCSDPYGITIIPGTTNAQINWQDVSTTNSWEIQVITSNQQPQQNGSQISSPNYLAENLLSLTEYSVYIRSVCSTGSNDWIGPINFTTVPDYCSGDLFYDTGGPNNPYSNSENYTTTIYPSIDADFISVTFTSFQIESGWDYLYIYDGDSIQTDLIGTYSGTNSPGTIQSTHPSGALTFTFSSDSIINDNGWEAIVVCEYLDCLSPNEVTISTILPTEATVSWNARGTESEWIIEYGLEGFTPGTGTTTTTSTNPYIISGLDSNTSYEVYIYAVCDPGQSAITSATPFTTSPDYCNGDRFYDSGGPNGYYANNENYTTTIYPSGNASSVLVSFDYLDLGTCCDYLYVYDGPDTSAPLIQEYQGDAFDLETLYSTHSSGALTFTFTSSGYDNYTGWDAAVVCEESDCLAPIDITFDNTTNDQTIVSWTARGMETEWIIEYGLEDFVPGSGTSITTSDNPFNLTGLDSVTNYDVYVYASCQTGQSAMINPSLLVTDVDYCNGDVFYDTGGPNGNYANNENYTKTIFPSAGNNHISVNFSYFQLESNYDDLYIYDGTDTSAPLIGMYTGNNSPGIVESTNLDGALTFRFDSDGSVTYGGWEATVICSNISCRPPSQIIIDFITDTEASVSWTAITNETNWIIEYGETGFLLGTGTTVSSTTTNVTVTNLNGSTTYDVYIYSDCSDSISNPSFVSSFETVCGVMQAPFHESFSMFNTPDCWNESGSEAWNFDTNADYAASNAGDHTLGGGTNYAWINASSPNGPNQISTLTTPWIDLSSIAYPSLEFAVFSNNENEDFYNTLEVTIQTTNQTSYSLVAFQRSSEMGDWEILSFDLTTLNFDSNIVQVSFTISENSENSPYYNDILIDDINIDSMPGLSVNEYEELTNIQFFPNPVKELLSIRSEEALTKVEIYNTLGQKVFESEYSATNQTDYSIPFTNYTFGVYFVKAFAEDKLKTVKIFKE